MGLTVTHTADELIAGLFPGTTQDTGLGRCFVWRLNGTAAGLDYRTINADSSLPRETRSLLAVIDELTGTNLLSGAQVELGALTVPSLNKVAALLLERAVRLQR